MGKFLESLRGVIQRRSGSDILIGALGCALFLAFLAKVVGSNLMVALCLVTAAVSLALLVVVWFVAVPEEVRSLVHRTARLQASFVGDIEEGKVTQDALTENAKANEDAWRELDRLLSGRRTDAGTKRVSGGT